MNTAIKNNDQIPTWAVLLIITAVCCIAAIIQHW